MNHGVTAGHGLLFFALFYAHGLYIIHHSPLVMDMNENYF